MERKEKNENLKIVKHLQFLMKLLKLHNINAIYVFDGEKHPRKLVAAERSDARDTALEKMEEIKHTTLTLAMTRKCSTDLRGSVLMVVKCI